MVLIKNGRIERSLSLNLGTVRLKELFTERGGSIIRGRRVYSKSSL